MAVSKRLWLIIASIVAGLAIIAGVTTAIITSKPNTNAYIGEEPSISVGNLLTNDGTGIDGGTYINLISLIGGGVNSVRGELKASDFYVSNNFCPVIFQMGEINGVPIYWEVVYRTGNYITVWMCEPYSVSIFNNRQISGLTYSSSDLREIVLNIFNQFSNNYFLLNLSNDGIIASPSMLEHATKRYWQSTNQINSVYSSGVSTNNNLSDDALYDAFWIPSYFEVGNISEDENYINSDTVYSGLWGLNSIMRGFDGGVVTTNDSVSSCWLRSIFPSSSPMYSTSSGSFNFGSSNAVNRGVRPATHLSLEVIESYLYNTVDTDFDFTKGAVTGSGQYNYGSIATLTAQPNSNCCFTGWTDSQGQLLSTNLSYSFVVTADTTITANFVDWINVTATGGTVSASPYFTQQSVTGILTIQPQSGYYVSAFSFDNNTFYTVDSWQAIISIDVPFCVNMEYAVSPNGLMGFTFNYIIMSYYNAGTPINLYLQLTTTPYSNLKTTGSVTGIAVTATYGGSVTLIGNDFEEMADTDYVTCVAKVCVQGYEFSGWYDVSDMNNCLSTSESTNFTKSQIMNSQIVASFEPINNGNINEDTNN